MQTYKTLIIFTFLIAFYSNSCISQTKETHMEHFEKISWEELNYNVIKLIGKDWMLITAGSIEDGFNMMTASWGNIGWLWEKPVSTIFVRPQRYTHEFTEREDYYTLSFFDDSHKDILRHLGSVSGRNTDKINTSGLQSFKTEHNSVAFEEAWLIIECKKLYSSKIAEDHFQSLTLSNTIYPKKDFHTMYIGEIVNIWRKKE